MTHYKPLISSLLTVLGVSLGLGLACTDMGEPDDSIDEAYELMDNLDELEIFEIAEITKPLDPPNAVCTLEAHPAAIVTVLQGVGNIVEPVQGENLVLYREWSPTDGWGEVREAMCLDDDCTRAALGYGDPGYYLIGAFACGDYALTGVEVGMTDDGCHVDTVHTSIVLDEVGPACMLEDDVQTEPTPPTDQTNQTGQTSATVALPTGTEEPPIENDSHLLPWGECPLAPPNPSVIATTGVIQGDLVWPWLPQVMVSMHESEVIKKPMQCLNHDCTMYVDEWGVTGAFQLTAELCGEQITKTVEVEPTNDGCNVKTEWVLLTVDAGVCNAATLAYTPED